MRLELTASQQREAEHLAAELSIRFAASRGASLDIEAGESRNSAEGCNH